MVIFKEVTTINIKPIIIFELKLIVKPEGINKISFIAWVNWLTLNNGKTPTKPLKLNITAKGFHLLPKPSVIKYIGPPWISPFESLPLYIIDKVDVKNFVDIPITPLIHIQKIDPGPPILIATATPAILPIPTVADRAVDKAPKWLI